MRYLREKYQNIQKSAQPVDLLVTERLQVRVPLGTNSDNGRIYKFVFVKLYI